MAIFLRHFVFKHPLFKAQRTAGGVRWDQSVYYLWWEFLRRHEGYKRTCASAGAGKYERLYAHFGDVHATTFKSWWSESDRGARLFAEPSVPLTVEAIELSDLPKLQEYWSEDLLVIAVPLTLRKRFIERRIKVLLKARHTRKRGQRTWKESRAMYPIRAQFKLHTLRTALKVYDMRRENPRMRLWEIAQSLRFTTTLDPDEVQRGEGVSKKAVMSVAVSKKLRQARQIIENVGRGRFP